MTDKKQINKELKQQLKQLHLSAICAQYEDISAKAVKESWPYEKYLWELVNEECQKRSERRILRNLKASNLPLEKTYETFDMKRLPQKIAQRIQTLNAGDFLARKENVLAFGNPGSGKTHLLSALGHELVHQGHRIYYTKCVHLVQTLLLAKKELRLPKILKKLAAFEAIIIDDIGYVHQAREEMEVLFTLLADRYEQGSVMITSNLPFSKWEQIFRDPMTTAAAIDRLIHHSVILEINLPSYRMAAAKAGKSRKGGAKAK